MLTPPPPTFPQIIGDDPHPDLARPTHDWREVAQKIHARCGAPSHVTLAEVEHHLERLFRRYCCLCELDRSIQTNSQLVSELWGGYDKNHNSLLWHLNKKMLRATNPEKLRRRRNLLEVFVRTR